MKYICARENFAAICSILVDENSANFAFLLLTGKSEVP